MTAFIEEHRDDIGGKPLIAPLVREKTAARSASTCRLPHLLRGGQIARHFCREGTFHDHMAKRANPDLLSDRARRDMTLKPEIERVIRGKKARMTIPDKSQPCPLDKVNRQLKAPNMLCVSDFTYVATWQGFVHVAFVIDAFARRIVGWRGSRTAHAGFVLDALEQAVHQRQPGTGLVHHSDLGLQCLSIGYTERLAEAGIEPSVGSVGDSYDCECGIAA